MNTRKILTAILLSVCLVFLSVASFAGEVKQGDKIKIVTVGTVARLCPFPNCGTNQHITRIPQGTTLPVEGIQDVKAGMMSVKWFEVTYKDKRGWVSVYDTDKQ